MQPATLSTFIHQTILQTLEIFATQKLLDIIKHRSIKKQQSVTRLNIKTYNMFLKIGLIV
jgi:hypothetical protein